ncbi:PAS domain-containing sensor histidine kinase [Silicimonas algicola]|uniref:histidine kinase n=1 Tax=Silicimonas algicola TaxID=1826607 RepID=A0A316GCC8_9RHOB|nr:PAS domain-containing sensor histidine kinase [Silicimonas algicola]AZQ67920.1 PAS domain-containing sensor histidine kinase [Silicimonas algicola]PWK57646.1 two-component system nitrogen regulation sensor histidine kinase NtrY [Silicimonas algicola]
MTSRARALTWEKVSNLRRLQRYSNAAGLGLVLLGPVLVLMTFAVLGPLDRAATALPLRLVLMADLVYALVVATLVGIRIAGMISARRARSAGSRLHLRLTGVFAMIALIPTVLVAIFAGMTINVGLEGWFSDRVSGVVGASLAAAEAYEEDQRRDLVEDVGALAEVLDSARRRSAFVSDGELRQLLGQGQALIQRGLREAFVIDGTGEIRARGERSYLFDFEMPDAATLATAAAGETAVVQDLATDELRALVRLDAFPDRFLYVSRAVDGRILGLLDEAAETAQLYNQLERERGRLVFEFGLLYLGFAVILILAAIWVGLWFAERLARPVGRLAGAAQRVGGGDLDVQVREEPGDDEIAMLGRLFNQMTRQLKGQRDALMNTNQQIEARRRLFDSVLSSVTAGVIGLDPQGRITFVNRSAERLLAIGEEVQAAHLNVAVPEFGGLLDRLVVSGRSVEQEEIRISRDGIAETLLVRIATRKGAEGEDEGHVIAFDDVTDLVAAQRLAAWGDVARRIAHEIKNPLTPIQLSAGRIKRKFRDALSAEQSESLGQLTDVIVRQTEDLRRIVDEFSKFARMPEPERSLQDLAQIVRDAVTLQEAAAGEVRMTSDVPTHPVLAELDATMIGQALTNIIKNAGEAIESLHESGKTPEGHTARVHVSLTASKGTAHITVSDNGIGLPEDRSRLFEPYVTTRAKGTGLGLPIVKKIIEEHGGKLTLTDAEPLDATGKVGARAEITLPLAAQDEQTGDLKVAE